MPQKRIVVAGATGYLGREVLQAFHNNGFLVRALARNPQKLDDLKDSCESIFVGEATKKETLKGLFEDVDIVFSSIGLRSFSRKPSLWDVDYQANMNLLEEAKKTGVKHFIFISAFRMNEKENRRRILFAEARERVADAIIESGMTWNIIRPNGFFNDMAEFFDMAKTGTVYLIGSGKTLINPIHGADLASRIVSCASDPSQHNQAIPCGGPDIFSMSQIAELAFETLNAKPKIRKIPSFFLSLGYFLTIPFNPNMASFLRFFQLVMTTPKIVAPQWGDHHLKDFFQELLEKSTSNN